MPSSTTKSLPRPCILVNLSSATTSADQTAATGEAECKPALVPSHSPARACSRAMPAHVLNVEAEMHDIAVPDDVVLAFEPHFSHLLRALLALAGEKVIIGDDLRADKAFLEIGVDYARGLRRSTAAADSPRPDFLRARGEIGLQPEQLVAGVDQTLEPGFGESHIGQEDLLVGIVEIGDLRLKRGADRDHGRAFAPGV